MSGSIPLSNRRSGSANPESGFVLLAVLILVALLFIALAVAVPKVTTDIRRDKETELYHRGMQYARAVRFFYKKFGRYPGSIDQLENTNDIRFLRKRYTDPITGKADWRIIHFGEATVRVTGLFGEPLQNSLSAPGQASMYAQPTNPDGTPVTDPNNPNNSGGGTIGTNSGSGILGNPGNPGNPGSPTGATPIGSPIGGGTGTDLGGGPIVGVASSSSKESIRLYRKQTHYNQWEFIYDPLSDSGLGVNTGAGMIQQPGQTNLNGASPIGGPTSPTSPNAPTSPQQ